MLTYRLPLNEVLFDFYDRLKSVSRGYAGFDYQIDDYREGDLVLMNILVNSEPVDALSVIVHHKEAERRGRTLYERLKDLIPRQLFQVAIQAAIRRADHRPAGRSRHCARTSSPNAMAVM
jgi:GTP-binding protein LepA